MTIEDNVKQLRKTMEIPVQEMIDKYGYETVERYVHECAETIARNTRLDCDNWDDPEWQMEAVIVAHGTLILKENRPNCME